MTNGDRSFDRRSRAAMLRRMLVIALGLFVFGTGYAAAAQNNPTQTPSPAGQDVDEGEVISFRTTEVLLPVTVRDRDGKLITTLSRSDYAP